MAWRDEFKTTEIELNNLRIRRRVRLVTYIVGKDADGKEVEFEVPDGAADAVMKAIMEGSQ